MNSINILIVVSSLTLLSAMPQWQNIQIPPHHQNGFVFNQGKSSLKGFGGYDNNGGAGLGIQGTHTFNQGTGISGTYFKSNHGGGHKLGLSHKFKKGFTSVFGHHSYAPKFKSNIYGISHNFGQGTSLFGTHTKSNYDGFKVKENNIGLSHKFKSGVSVNVFGGDHSITGPQFGAGVRFPIGKK